MYELYPKLIWGQKDREVTFDYVLQIKTPGGWLVNSRART